MWFYHLINALGSILREKIGIFVFSGKMDAILAANLTWHVSQPNVDGSKVMISHLNAVDETFRTSYSDL